MSSRDDLNIILNEPLIEVRKQRERDISWMQRAFQISDLGNCLRRKVGCVITTYPDFSYQEGPPCITGVNTAPIGKPSCEDLGQCLLRDMGGRLGCIRTTHAEIVAIANAAKRGVSVQGGTAYCTTKPCLNCAKALMFAGVFRVVSCSVNESIPNDLQFLVEGLKFEHIDPLEIVTPDFVEKQGRGYVI